MPATIFRVVIPLVFHNRPKVVNISCSTISLRVLVGGNQRDLARQKNAKKQNEMTKGKRNEDGLSSAARKQRCASRKPLC